MTSTEKLVAEQFSATIAPLNLLSPRMNLRLAVLIGLLSLLTLVATAQPVAEPPGAERRQITVGAQPRARKHIGRSGDQAAASSASVFSTSSGENASEPGISGSAPAMMPTRSSFIANWQKVDEATGLPARCFYE